MYFWLAVKNAGKSLVKKLLRNRTLGQQSGRWGNCIKMDSREKVSEYMTWAGMA
jgi:hypothetical protein